MIASIDRQMAIDLVHQHSAAGFKKQPFCKLLGICYRTFQRWNKVYGLIDHRREAIRRKPANKLEKEEVQRIFTTLNSSPYRDMSPCKIVPALADQGMYMASESTFYRLLKQFKQLKHRGYSKPRSHHKPKALVATAPNQVWSWDITYLPSAIKGYFFYLYMIVDIFSRKIVGFHVHEKESAENAARLMTEACYHENIDAHQLVLHSDNGAPMKGLSMLATLEKLGVMPSFSRPGVSDDNPFSESLFKTLKYHPTFPVTKCFADMNQARLWCEQFVNWYNHEHVHSALKFVTPSQRHSGQDIQILQNRHQVYLKAQQKNPIRWAKKTRNWTLPSLVTLNPDTKRKTKLLKK